MYELHTALNNTAQALLYAEKAYNQWQSMAQNGTLAPDDKSGLEHMREVYEKLKKEQTL